MTYHKGWRERIHWVTPPFLSKFFFPLYFDLLFSIIFEHPAVKRKVIFHLILDLCKSIIHVMNNYTFSNFGVHTRMFISSAAWLRCVSSLLLLLMLLFSCCLALSSAETFFSSSFSSLPSHNDVYLFKIWIWLVFGIVCVFFHSSFLSPLYSR